MANHVGGCYYHEGRLAVATCSRCGVGLCRECVRKDGGVIICPNCERERLRKEARQYNEQIKEEGQARQQWLKERGGHFATGKDFLIPALIGLVLAGWFCGSILYSYLKDLFSWWAVGEGYTPTVGETIQFIVALARELIPWFYLVFSIPFGYITARDAIPHRIIVGTLGIVYAVCRLLIILAVAVCLGWVFFTFYWVRFLVRRRRAKKAQAVQPSEGQDPPTPAA